MQTNPVTQARQQLMSHLEQAMEERGLSIDQVAAQTGLGVEELQDLFTGAADISVDRMLALCLAIGVDIDLNTAPPENDPELPAVMVCEEPIEGSSIYLIHTASPRSLWYADVVEDASDTEDGEVAMDFRTLDGHEEAWRIGPAAIYEGATEQDLQRAGERCAKYLRAYLSWEDEDLRKANSDGLFQ